MKLSDTLVKVVDNRGKTPPYDSSVNDYELIETASLVGNNKYPDYSRIGKWVSKETFENWFRSGHPIKDDVMIATVGANIGSVAIMKETRGCVAQNLVAFRTNREILNPHYLYYYLSWENTQRHLKNLDIGAAQPSIKVPHILDLDIPLPPVPLQRRIADILSVYDNLIENNTRRIRILEQMAQAIYQEWFGKVDANTDSLPKGWKLVKLLEIAEVNSTTIKNGNEPEEINYVDIASVSTGKIDTIQPMKFSSAPSRARRIVKHGDVIWSTVRPNRKSFSLIINPTDNMVVSTGFAVLRAKSVPFSFLYLATTTDSFADYLTKHATGAAYPAVNSSDFENAEIVLPSKEILTRFEKVTVPMFILRENMMLKNTNLRQTRDLLLPRLVSGEIEVSELGNN